jgi:hypothetical protein
MEYGIYKFGELTFEIEYDYYAGEQGVMYYGDGSGYPSSSPSVEINSIYLNDTEVMDILTDFFIDTIEIHLLNSHE